MKGNETLVSLYGEMTHINRTADKHIVQGAEIVRETERLVARVLKGIGNPDEVTFPDGSEAGIKVSHCLDLPQLVEVTYMDKTRVVHRLWLNKAGGIFMEFAGEDGLRCFSYLDVCSVMMITSEVRYLLYETINGNIL